MLIFAEKWIHKHGDKPEGEWINVFLVLDEQKIKNAVHRMRKDAEAKIKAGDEAWPPSAFEFTCLGKAQSSLYFHSPDISLPAPEKDLQGKEYKKFKEFKRKLK